MEGLPYKRPRPVHVSRPIELPGSFREGCEAGNEECCKALLQLGGDEQLLLNSWTVGWALLLIRDLSEPVKLQSSAARQLHSWVGVVVDSKQKLICPFSKTVAPVTVQYLQVDKCWDRSKCLAWLLKKMILPRTGMEDYDPRESCFCSSVTNVIALQLRAFSAFSYLCVQCSAHAGSVTV